MDPDLIKGASGIAKHLGLSERQVYNLIESCQLPAFQIGSRWYARRSTLTEFFASLERQTAGDSD